ncbi:MAG: TRAP transporter large permease [Bacillota bacterium]|jgi:C4-dicarboxylate transporter DctM subunit
MIALLLGIMIGCLALGFPMMLGMILAPLAVLTLYYPVVNPMLMIQQLIAGVSPFSLLAVPMFILAADIMCTGQTAQRLLDFVDTFVGHIKGGMSITAAATCTIFGSISGSTQATLVAIGKPMMQPMLKAGYNESHVIGLMMCSANIALLIPPSICMIMYAVVTGTSVGELFIGGVGPGLLILLFFSVYEYFYAGRKEIPVKPKCTWKERWDGFRRALWPLGFPVLVLGGIYTGLFSPTEAAAMSVLYAALLELIVFKSITIKDLPRIALSTGMVTAAVFILVAGGQAFSWVITFAQIPQMLTTGILGTDPSALYVLVVISIFFFIGCMFVDSIPVIIILAPIFFPVAVQAGIDPVHLGIIVTLQSAIGAVTPPFGCNIFTACAIYDRTFLNVIKGLAPYMIMFIMISVIMILVPDIALFLVKMMY